MRKSQIKMVRLSDGSYNYDVVFFFDELGLEVSFNCISEEHAQRLWTELETCVDWEVRVD